MEKYKGVIEAVEAALKKGVDVTAGGEFKHNGNVFTFWAEADAETKKDAMQRARDIVVYLSGDSSIAGYRDSAAWVNSVMQRDSSFKNAIENLEKISNSDARAKALYQEMRKGGSDFSADKSTYSGIEEKGNVFAITDKTSVFNPEFPVASPFKWNSAKVNQDVMKEIEFLNNEYSLNLETAFKQIADIRDVMPDELDMTKQADVDAKVKETIQKIKNGEPLDAQNENILWNGVLAAVRTRNFAAELGDNETVQKINNMIGDYEYDESRTDINAAREAFSGLIGNDGKLPEEYIKIVPYMGDKDVLRTSSTEGVQIFTIDRSSKYEIDRSKGVISYAYMKEKGGDVKEENINPNSPYAKRREEMKKDLDKLKHAIEIVSGTDNPDKFWADYPHWVQERKKKFEKEQEKAPPTVTKDDKPVSPPANDATHDHSHDDAITPPHDPAAQDQSRLNYNTNPNDKLTEKEEVITYRAEVPHRDKSPRNNTLRLYTHNVDNVDGDSLAKEVKEAWNHNKELKDTRYRQVDLSVIIRIAAATTTTLLTSSSIAWESIKEGTTSVIASAKSLENKYSKDTQAGVSEVSSKIIDNIEVDGGSFTLPEININSFEISVDKEYKYKKVSSWTNIEETIANRETARNSAAQDVSDKKDHAINYMVRNFEDNLKGIREFAKNSEAMDGISLELYNQFMDGFPKNAQDDKADKYIKSFFPDISKDNLKALRKEARNYLNKEKTFEEEVTNPDILKIIKEETEKLQAKYVDYVGLTDEQISELGESYRKSLNKAAVIVVGPNEREKIADTEIYINQPEKALTNAIEDAERAMQTMFKRALNTWSRETKNIVQLNEEHFNHLIEETDLKEYSDIINIDIGEETVDGQIVSRFNFEVKADATYEEVIGLISTLEKVQGEYRKGIEEKYDEKDKERDMKNYKQEQKQEQKEEDKTAKKEGRKANRIRIERDELPKSQFDEARYKIRDQIENRVKSIENTVGYNDAGNRSPKENDNIPSYAKEAIEYVANLKDIKYDMQHAPNGKFPSGDTSPKIG